MAANEVSTGANTLTAYLVDLPFNTTDSFTFGFPYLDRVDFRLEVDKTDVLDATDYEFTSDYLIKLTQTGVDKLNNIYPKSGETQVSLSINRSTKIGERLVDFQDGANLTEEELDLNANQIFYLLQEAYDNFLFGSLQYDPVTDTVDANGAEIVNVGAPTSSDSALRLQELEDHEANTATHGVTSDIVGTTDAQTIENKKLINLQQMELPKGTLSELTAYAALPTTRTGELVYSTSDNEVYKVVSGLLKPIFDVNRLGEGVPIPVTSYGADSSGVSSSNAAILASIADQGYAYFPKGTYLVSDCVIGSSAKLHGEGHILKDPDATVGFHVTGSNVEIEGLTFKATSSNVITGASDVKLGDGARYVDIRDCFFLSEGVYASINGDTNGADDSSLTYITQVENVKIKGCTFKGDYSRHLYLHNINTLLISHNHFEDTNFDAIRLRQAIDNCIISDNHFKNIGIESENDFEQRPDNWTSIDQYTTDDLVSIPPYGIYKCLVASSTIGANPVSSGSAEWEQVNGYYFETKDAIDTFWSGKSLIISNNIIDKTAAVGFDIKGTEPTDKYATRKIIIQGNLIKNTYGRGIFLNNSGTGSYLATGEILVSNNIIEGCNRERFDINEGAIHIRSGMRNVTISNNIVHKNYGRGINLLNLDETVPMLKNISVLGNTVVSNGMAGDDSSIGIYITPVEGLIVKDNTCTNDEVINEYLIDVVTDQVDTGTLTIPTRVTGVDLEIDYDPAADHDELISRLNAELQSKVFQDFTTYTVNYFGNLQTYGGDVATAEDSTSSVLFTTKQGGSPSNDISIVLVGTTGSNLYPQPTDYSWDSVTKTLTVAVRASATQAQHLVASYPSAPQEFRDLVEAFEVINGNDTVIIAGANGVTETINFSGATSVYTGIDAKLANMLSEGTYTSDGVTFTVTKQEGSNSVQATGIYFNQENPLGTRYLRTPVRSAVISNNNCSGNNKAFPRFNILLDGQEPPVLLAYVAAGDENSTTVAVPLARTLFSGGTNSSPSSHLDTRATLTTQGITLSSVEFGTDANNISLTIVQGTDPDAILGVTVAPYVFNGREIVVNLPTDDLGAPVDATIGDVVKALRKELGQALLDFSGNYIGHDI